MVRPLRAALARAQPTALRAHLDAEHPLEARRGAEAEQAAAAVGVDEKARAAGSRLGGDVRGQLRQQERVVLEEVARQELQRQLADLLGDHRARVDGDARGGLAHQQRRALAIALPAGAHLGAQLGEARVHARAWQSGRRGRRSSGAAGRLRGTRSPPGDRRAGAESAASASTGSRRGAATARTAATGVSGKSARTRLGLERELLVVGEVLQLAAAAARRTADRAATGRTADARRRGTPRRTTRSICDSRVPVAALQSVAMEQALAAFRQFLTAEKRASEHTVRAYLHDLGEFRAHAEATLGRAPTLDELDVIMCRSYLASLHGKNDAVTIGRKLSSLRAFFRLAVRRRLCKSSPVAALRAPKRAKRLPSFLGKEDVGRLLDADQARASDDVGRDACGQRARAGAVRGDLRRRAARLGGLQPRPRRPGDRRGRARWCACGRARGARIAIVPIGSKARQAYDAYLAAARRSARRGRRPSTPRAVPERARPPARAARRAPAARPAASSPRGRRASRRTRSATASPPTCSARGPTCAPSKRCSATPASAPRSATPTSTSTT